MPEDKFVIGYYLTNQLIGCAELLKFFPDENTAYIGLLIISEPHQGQGIGTQVLGHIYETAATWGCSQIRLAVISTNTAGYSFWTKAGFQEVDRKPYRNALGPAIIMQRPNPSLNSDLAYPLHRTR
jgi:GNAT superfamily N-acetyltransferase